MSRKLNFTGIILLSSLVACAFTGIKVPTTNNVDMIFGDVSASTIGKLGQKCVDAGFRNGGSDSLKTIRKYAFDRLLAIPITTNMLWASYMLGEKTRWIEESEFMLGIRLDDAELRNILQCAVAMSPISTNNLAVLEQEAIQRDVSQWGSAVNNVGSPRANLARWRNHAQRVHRWNQAVQKFRQRLAEFVCRKYDKLHADVPETERRGALREILLEYGFSQPDPMKNELYNVEQRPRPGTGFVTEL